MKQYIIKEKKNIFLSMFFGILSSITIIYLGLKLGNIVDYATNSDFNYMKKYTVVVFVSTVFLLIMFILEKKHRQEYIMNVANNLRNDILKNLLRIPMYQLKKNDSDYYFNIINNDIELLMDRYLDSLIEFFNASIAVIVSATILFIFHPLILLVSIIASLLPVIVSNIFIEPYKKVNNEKSKENEKYLTKIHETIYGLDVIKRSNRSNNFRNNFDKVVKSLGEKINKLEIFGYFVNRTMWSVNSLIQTLIIVVCSILILKGNLTSGALISSIILVTNFVENLTKTSINFTAIKSSKDLSKRAIDMIKNREGSNKEYVELVNESVESLRFEDVSFSYGEKSIFKSVNFDIYKNNCVAIIGKSGSGKTTLINLLLNFETRYSGSIKINDFDIRYISEEKLYRIIYLVPQDTFIFRCDLFDNISMYDERNKANIDKFENIINTLDINYLLDRNNSQNELSADNLSGGEKKRIAIARALYQNSKIIIFDEPTSGLDPRQAEIINEIIFSLSDKLRIVITHNWDEKYLSRFKKVININDFK